MDKENKGPNISVRSYLAALAVIFMLMALTYALTFLIPGGEYGQITDANGNKIIDMASGFEYVPGGISFVKWLFSPILVFTAEGSGTLIAVIIFLLVIGGVFNCLESCSLIPYLLYRISSRYASRRYTLLAVVTFFFMAMGAMVGSFEECVPLVPLVVALALDLGWDALTGMGMSLIAVGCGFASGVLNPFTVGVAQELAGLPMFSGIWLRLVSFVLIYLLLLFFLMHRAKKVEKPVSTQSPAGVTDFDPRLSRGVKCFAGALGFGMALVMCSPFVPLLQDLTMVIIALMFLVGGVSASIASGLKGRALCRSFANGLLGILPAVLLIMMASSIRYTLVEAKALDSILHASVTVAELLPKWLVILFIYMLVLVMNFFIASGSAKAFLLIPLIVPIASVFGISPQLCVLAFAFGDGFSNVFYPTNPALLISLGLADVSYSAYARWSWKFQVLNLLLTGSILLLGLWIGY